MCFNRQWCVQGGIILAGTVLQREVGERQAEIACIGTGNNPNLMLQDIEGHIPGSHGMYY